MRISDWSSDVCSSDLQAAVIADDRRDLHVVVDHVHAGEQRHVVVEAAVVGDGLRDLQAVLLAELEVVGTVARGDVHEAGALVGGGELGRQQRHVVIVAVRSEEHTSELQSLMRISYAVFCLKKKNKQTDTDLLKLATRED